MKIKSICKPQIYPLHNIVIQIVQIKRCKIILIRLSTRMDSIHGKIQKQCITIALSLSKNNIAHQ